MSERVERVIELVHRIESGRADLLRLEQELDVLIGAPHSKAKPIVPAAVSSPTSQVEPPATPVAEPDRGPMAAVNALLTPRRGVGGTRSTKAAAVRADLVQILLANGADMRPADVKDEYNRIYGGALTAKNVGDILARMVTLGECRKVRIPAADKARVLKKGRYAAVGTPVISVVTGAVGLAAAPSPPHAPTFAEMATPMKTRNRTHGKLKYREGMGKFQCPQCLDLRDQAKDFAPADCEG